MTGGHRQLTATEHSGSAGQRLFRTDILRGTARGGAGRSHAAAARGAGGGMGRDGFTTTSAAAAVSIAAGIVEQQTETGVELILLQFLIQEGGVVVNSVASFEKKGNEINIRCVELGNYLS